MEPIVYSISGSITPNDLITSILAEITLSTLFYSLDTNFDEDGNETSIQITFTENLSEDQQTTLDTLVTNFSFANPLKTAKSARIAALQMDIESYLEGHYSFLLRNQMFNLYVLAKFDSLANRAAYLRPGINWMNSIILYASSISASIQTRTTIEDVQSVTWNIAGNTTADPSITLAGALSISN